MSPSAASRRPAGRAERAARAAIGTADRSLIPTQLTRDASAARRRMCGKDGGFRRDHLRAFAQRVEVAEHEARIMGSHNELLGLLTSSNGAETAANSVRSFVPGWRRRRDSNPRDGFPPTPLAGERLRPLGHVSADGCSRRFGPSQGRSGGVGGSRSDGGVRRPAPAGVAKRPQAVAYLEIRIDTDRPEGDTPTGCSGSGGRAEGSWRGRSRSSSPRPVAGSG